MGNRGGAERRGSERLTINLSARVDLDGRDPRSAQITDFCSGGLFLRVQGQEDDYLVLASRQIARDDRLRVTFDGDPGDGLRTFTVTVKVARLFLGGIGVVFEPPDYAAIRALELLAAAPGSAAAIPGAQGSPEPNALLTDIDQQARQWLRTSLDGVFKFATNELFVEARDAPNNDLQSAAMDALRDVERVQTAVCDAAMQGVLRALGRLTGNSSSSLAEAMTEADDNDGGSGLALVDTNSFDDWLTTKNIITRHEPALREAAYALSRRLEVITGKHIDELGNPLGVQQVGSAFNDAMQNTGLEKRSRREIYKGFEESLIPELAKLYEQLNTLLVKNGILPVVERPGQESTQRARRPRPQPAAMPEQAPGPTEEIPVADEPYAPPGHSGPSQQYPAGAGRHSVPGPGHAQPQYPAAAGGHSAPGPGQAPPQYPAGAAAGVNPWAATPLSESPGGTTGSGAVNDSGAQGASAAAVAAPTDAVAAPAPRVAYQSTYHSPIQPGVSQVGMERAYQAARSMMGMQRAMTSGAAVSGFSQAPLETPAQHTGAGSQLLLDALSAMQTSVEFNQPTAPQSRRASPLKERLRSALQRSGVALDTDENEAIEVLGNLIEAVLEDPLIQAEVKPRIQRLSVPLLRTAMQDQGFFEQESHPARQVINRLGLLGLPEALASGQAGDSLQSSVDPILDRMLADPTAGPEAFDAVLPELDGLLARQNEQFESNVRNIVTAREQQQAMLAKRRSAAGPAVARRVTPELEPWFRRTERLKVGDAVTFRAGSDSPQTRTLAWVADNKETFVFAGPDGRESGAVAQQELALDMLRGSAKVADSADVPAMDRGVYQVLHDIHRSLSEEGRRDSLTGLMPMSAFELRVAEAIGRAQRRGSRHAVLALNLDGFKTINKQCGRDAGDSLLRKLSRLLDRQIAGQGCLARAFADEFLILLEDHPLQDARRFAERQCRAIENSRVVFGGEQYPITASVGLVPVNRAGASAATVIESARAALAGAKRQGGNQLRIFDPDKDKLPEKDRSVAAESKAFAAGDTIEDASAAADAPLRGGEQADGARGGLMDLIGEGRIVLQRQLVSPLGEDSAHKAHYEVLLGVRVASGAIVAVSDDLLSEAEGSERMVEADRWVIHNALQWMAAHRRDVVRSGGYAINLSVAAFADDSLLEFVVAELSESTIPPAKIIFVITEAVAIDPLSSAVGFIRAMRDYGCRFAIDDFGAGNATFAYLKTLPVDYVEIDPMFVRELADSDNDYAMVKSINEIAHLMGKLTVAKDANSDATVARLKELGVDFTRGDPSGERETLQ